MKEENKQLLLKDLCGRLPYGVKIRVEYPFWRKRTGNQKHYMD